MKLDRYLVDLALLLLVAGRRGATGGRHRGQIPRRRMTQAEVGVAKVAISFHVVKRLPHQALLAEEALVRHQQVQVALRQTPRDSNMSDVYSVRQTNDDCVCSPPPPMRGR